MKKIVISTLVIGGGVLISLFILFAAMVPNCGSNSEAVALARGLSQERLGKLYIDIKRLNDEAKPIIFYNLPNSNIPVEFEGLQPKKIHIDGQKPRIMLEGCIDHFVMLYFYGMEDGEKKIELQWDEWPVMKEILWIKKD